MREKDFDADNFTNPLAKTAGGGAAARRPDVFAEHQLREVTVGAHFESCWYTPDGRWFGVGGQDKKITVYDVASGASTDVGFRAANIRAANSTRGSWGSAIPQDPPLRTGPPRTPCILSR